jgi:hypothetical protein
MTMQIHSSDDHCRNPRDLRRGVLAVAVADTQIGGVRQPAGSVASAGEDDGTRHGARLLGGPYAQGGPYGRRCAGDVDDAHSKGLQDEDSEEEPGPTDRSGMTRKELQRVARVAGMKANLE